MSSHYADHKKRDIVLFSLPYLAIYVAFLVFPVIYGVYLSFFDWNILSSKVFIGFKNYVEAFRDPEFLSSFSHTLQFVCISTPLIIIVGFVMALITIQPTRTGRVAETVFFLPYMLSTSVVGTLWAKYVFATPATPKWPQCYDVMSDQLEESIALNRDAKTALTKLEQAINDILKK